jgi:hypothetical protein
MGKRGARMAGRGHTRVRGGCTWMGRGARNANRGGTTCQQRACMGGEGDMHGF